MKTKVKVLLQVSAVLLAGFFFSCTTIWDADTSCKSEVHHLVVLHTNDTHGHPVKFFKYPAPDVGGLPARATLVKRIKGEVDNVLVLDAGDINIGRPESTLFDAKPDIEGYNYIGYDAMTLGNHEFDNPIEVLEEQMKLAEFPFLSANVKKENGAYLARPYIVKEFKGFRVAIFGLTTKDTEFIANPEHIKNFVFEDEIDVAKTLVPELRNKADVVIALVHMGIYDSSEKGSKRLASEVSGIDLIIDGHTHTRLDAPIAIINPLSAQSTIIVQAWEWGLVLGKVDLFIQDKRVIDYRFEAIPINLKRVVQKPDGTNVYQFLGEMIPEEEELLMRLEPYVARANGLLSEVVGKAETTLFVEGVREKETPLGNLVADSMLWYTKDMGVDFALQNGGGIRADLPKGPITRGTILELLPFDNSVVVLTLDGSTVQSLFDHIATVSGGQGGFPQVSKGLSFKINRESQRCVEIRINGKRLDTSRTYKIATNSYLARGGDGYKIFLNALSKYDCSIFQRDVLAEYIEHLGGTVKPQVSGRINLIRKEMRNRPFQLAADSWQVASAFARASAFVKTTADRSADRAGSWQ
jgi:5'-nucleotidase/UDP-sugar diphosphatase